MVYASEANKWRAYQFLDPFAAGLFVVCNKINTYFCRPDCDAHPITELRLEIKFVDTASDAIKLGYMPCKTCDPTLVPTIDVNLLLKTVKVINSRIGFVPPLLDDDEEKVTETIKENIIGSGSQRRMLVPANSFNKFPHHLKSAQMAVLKNDLEHYRLIDLACRHLALAAALSIFGPALGESSPKLDATAAGKKRGGRKRRGGVLGFKELATKSKLSAWHFHRVFKSIIGLTPKTYGDMCWEYLENEKDAMESGTQVIPLNEEQFLTPPQTAVLSPSLGQKRSHADDLASPTKKLHMELPALSPFAGDELDVAVTRATSVPNLSLYGHELLFNHLRTLDMCLMDEVADPAGHFMSFNDQQLGPAMDLQPPQLASDISPLTDEDITPSTLSNAMSPLIMHTDMPMSSLDLTLSIQNLGFAGEPVFPEMDLYATMDFLADDKLRFDLPLDAAMHGSLPAGYGQM